MSSSKFSYEEAIRKLNLLQSNKASIEQIRRDMLNGQKCKNLEAMENYLLRTGVSMTRLDELPVIHIAGTKGKGSTSAMCESILRHHGFRTGFYSSPHLTAVRERVRVNGRVLEKGQFAKHFHQVYDMLDSSQAFEGDMPKYFAFLTVLAYNVFLDVGVDVAIIEVGIGGSVDSTNVLRKVPIVGITTLGLDHTSILGNTLTDIARSKAGIMKPGCEAYTVQQAREASEELRRVAREVNCPLFVVPGYNTYRFPIDRATVLPVNLPAYEMNASLAVQLAHAWLRASKQASLEKKSLKTKQHVGGKIMRHTEIGAIITDDDKDVEHFVSSIPYETVLGLRECKWPGRYQTVDGEYATFFLDGAHTKESMEICAEWFKDKERFQAKILIFSSTGDRDAELLLGPLVNMDFKIVYFVIPRAMKDTSQRNDNYSLMEQKELITRCHNNAEVWKKYNKKSEIVVMDCVSDALINVKQRQVVDKKSVLITGSLHLVGAALSIIDPNLSED